MTPPSRAAMIFLSKLPLQALILGALLGAALAAPAEGPPAVAFSSWPVTLERPGHWPSRTFLAVGRAGNLYIGQGNRVQRFSPEGRNLGEFQTPAPIISLDASNNLYLRLGAALSRYSPAGERLGQIALETPRATAALKPAGEFLILQTSSGAFTVYNADAEGRRLSSAAVSGRLGLSNAHEIRIFASPDGGFYLVQNDKIVQRFDPAGRLLTAWRTGPHGYPIGIGFDVDDRGRFYAITGEGIHGFEPRGEIFFNVPREPRSWGVETLAVDPNGTFLFVLTENFRHVRKYAVPQIAPAEAPALSAAEEDFLTALSTLSPGLTPARAREKGYFSGPARRQTQAIQVYEREDRTFAGQEAAERYYFEGPRFLGAEVSFSGASAGHWADPVEQRLYNAVADAWAASGDRGEDLWMTERPADETRVDVERRLWRRGPLRFGIERSFPAEGPEVRLFAVTDGFADVVNADGFAAYRRGNLYEAVVLFERAVAVNPSHAKAHYNLACALALLVGPCDITQFKAVRHLAEAVRLEPARAQQMLTDKDLDKIRATVGYQELLGHSAKNDADLAALLQKTRWYTEATGDTGGPGHGIAFQPSGRVTLSRYPLRKWEESTKITGAYSVKDKNISVTLERPFWETDVKALSGRWQSDLTYESEPRFSLAGENIKMRFYNHVSDCAK